MNKANDEPAANASAGRASWREAIGVPLRNRRPLVAAKLLLILLPFALRALGAIRNASLLLLPTILLGIGIGIAYDAADILVFLRVLRRLTGQAVHLEQFGALRGDLGAVLLLLGLTWTLAAFGEELAYRGFALNRICSGAAGRPSR